MDNLCLLRGYRRNFCSLAQNKDHYADDENSHNPSCDPCDEENASFSEGRPRRRGALGEGGEEEEEEEKEEGEKKEEEEKEAEEEVEGSKLWRQRQGH